MTNSEIYKMNILEAYIKKKNQFIILILGLPCSNKSAIAKELVIDLKLPLININDYLIKDKFIEKNIDDVKFKLYEHSDNFAWEKINEDVNKVKSNGLILYGNFIDLSKIDFKIDFTFFMNMNNSLCKDILVEKKLLSPNLDDNKIKIYFEKIFNPLYEELKQNININKFFNVKKESNFDEIYDKVFDTLMDLIKSKL